MFLCLRIIFLKSSYSGNETSITGTILSYQIDGNQLKIEIQAKEKIMVQYYFKEEQEKLNFTEQYHLGNQIEVIGILKQPSRNRNFHLFNYQNYLKSKKIFWILEGDKITRISENQSILLSWKEKLFQQMDKMENAIYLKYLLLGDSSGIDATWKKETSFLGISHLFAISGMHIHLFVGMILWILKKVTKKEQFHLIVLTIFLSFYCFLTSFSPSVVRASAFFLLLQIKRLCKWKISSLFLLLLVLLGMLFYNPFYCYHLGFVFSFLISFSLLYFGKYQKKQNYFKQLFQTSWIAFWMGVPILIHNFFQVNFLTPIWNLFFVPFVSLLLFPVCVICLFFPFLNSILDILLFILEKCMRFGNQITLLQFSFSAISLPIIVGYYIVIVYALYSFLKKRYIPFFILILLLFTHYHITVWNPNPTLTMLDVGQGDSLLITLPHSQGNILIDTGGIMSYNQKSWQQKKKEYSINESVLIPYLRSVGIHSLDYLILTHGDYDHMGEAIHFIEHFKVEQVILNCGEYNALEHELLKVLEQKNIDYYNCVRELNIGKYRLQFLNTKEYDNENDNSSVIYTKLNDFQFLFMGDAGMEKENDIMKQYQIENIDVLKVGHHGSNTSSSKEFINQISPKLSLISAGENNRYKHPKNEVLDILSHSQIFRTDKNGSIKITITKNAYKIKTCL